MSPSPGETRIDRVAPKALGFAAVAVFLAAVSWVLYLGWKRPIRNFDLVDYVALALEWVEDEPQVVQRRTYEIAEAELPPELFENFRSGSAFRQQIHADWKLFDANLGFHRGRYLYTLAVLVLHALGAPWTAATWYLNQIFWGLTAVLVLAWAWRHYSPGPAALLALGVMLSPPVVSIVPASSPDGMAMFLVALGLYLLVEHRAFRAAAAVLALTVLVRTDFVLIAFGVAAALFFFLDVPERPSNRFLALLLGACTALYAVVSATARDPGWWAVFIAPFRRHGDLGGIPPFEPGRYAFVLRRKLEEIHYLGYEVSPDGSFVRGSSFVLVYLVAAALGVVLALRSRLRTVELHLAVLSGLIAATVVRYVLFPYLWDRYFVYLWVPVPLCLGALLALIVARVRSADEGTEDA